MKKTTKPEKRASASRHLNPHFTFRDDPADHADQVAAAARAGMSWNTWARGILRKALRKAARK